MSTGTKKVHSYAGFEQGPIRPPSEAHSLLVRVTRNCPWNRCTFCPVYKGARFSIRPVESVRRDIDAVHRQVERLLSNAADSGGVLPNEMSNLIDRPPAEEDDYAAYAAALQWIRVGRMKSVFLQDANSLVVRTPDLVDILMHLTTRFPHIERVTSYARSQTVAAKTESDVRALREAGLDRLHLGLESGCDEVLKAVHKGVTKQQHIDAGLKVKAANIELSEYIMPGLGGQSLSRVHALETADVLNRVNPDFIRIRTLAVHPRTPLFEECQSGSFSRCSDLMIVRELLTLIENLSGITSVVLSDHILNLFEDLEGKLPEDKEHLLNVLESFLTMPPEQRMFYQVGRRLGIVRRLCDLDNPHKTTAVSEAVEALEITPENVDDVTQALMARYL